MPKLRLLPLLLVTGLLGGCNMVVMNPSGDVAAQQRDLILIATGLMLVVIIPVMVMTVLFAFRYRASNTEAPYDPEWDHSTQIELAVWAVPLLIIIALGAFTWAGTHLLDPYRPLGRIDHQTPIAEEHEPLEVQVVALDWKWLFILPEYGVASVNELAAPVDRPITFKLTSTSVMNAFYIPAMAGMIYTMPGMETTLHGVINKPGEYEGFSANYSGAGFSKMRFAFHGTDEAGFDAWIEKARSSEAVLDRETYLALERPSEGNPVQLYSQADADLFPLIVNMCVQPGTMCMSEMAAIDRQGGLGLAGIHNTLPLTAALSDRKAQPVFGAAPSYVAAICTEDEAIAGYDAANDAELRDRFASLSGFGLLAAAQPPEITPATAPNMTPLPSRAAAAPHDNL